MNKKNKPIWGTRIKGQTSSIFQKVSSSIDIDKRLFKEDIKASIIHVEMLNKQKIINFTQSSKYRKIHRPKRANFFNEKK